jgi:flagellar hook-associated protein 1 FlgK
VLVTLLTSAQQSVSGVNINEEAANLLQYQQLYQANSKVIQTAETLFQTIIGIFQ